MNFLKNQVFRTRTAVMISRLTEPMFWLPLMIWLVLVNINIPEQKRPLYYSVLLVFIFVIPFLYFLYLVYVRKEFDFDITERPKRIGFITKSMLSFAFAALLTYYMEYELFIVTAAVFLSVLGLFIVTLWWKISFHAGLNTLIYCTVNYLYEWQFWWLFLLLIPIGWARLTMKKHNLPQFLAGISLCAVTFVFVTGVL